MCFSEPWKSHISYHFCQMLSLNSFNWDISAVHQHRFVVTVQYRVITWLLESRDELSCLGHKRASAFHYTKWWYGNPIVVGPLRVCTCTDTPGTHYICLLFALVKKSSKQTVVCQCRRECFVCALHSSIPINGCLFFLFFTQDTSMRHSGAVKTKFIHE